MAKKSTVIILGAAFSTHIYFRPFSVLASKISNVLQKEAKIRQTLKMSSSGKIAPALTLGGRVWRLQKEAGVQLLKGNNNYSKAFGNFGMSQSQGAAFCSKAGNKVVGNGKSSKNGF